MNLLVYMESMVKRLTSALMWTNDTHAKYDRDKLRYPSDLTDAEWGLVEPLIAPAEHRGRDREVDMREVANGIMYALRKGCKRRPKSAIF